MTAPGSEPSASTDRPAESAATEAVELSPADREVYDVLCRTLSYARERDYTGWDYGDGMSSRIRRAIPVESKWLNLAFQEAVKRAPINVRPLLLVERRRNYKGIALFAMANQTAERIRTRVETPDASDEDVDFAAEARTLADWLLDNSTDGYGGFCAGFQHPIQHLDGRGEAGEPDVINTSFGVKALLRAAAFDERYAAAVESTPGFLVEDLNFEPVEPRGAVVDYHTKHPQDYYTINAGAICARTFLDLYAHFGDDAHLQRAEALLDHVADLQTDLGGWQYRDPPEASHLSMDTHHNGFVVESFQRHRAVTDSDRYEETLGDALSFFRDRLFEEDGAPNFDEQSAYPRDVHATTQGALVFTYAGDLAFARRILRWAFSNLAAGDGGFYYRKERFHTKRAVLMRWCQAWMAYATSEYLAARLPN